MDRFKIQQEVKRIHREIWANQDSLWPEQSLSPIQMLQPEVACRILGIEYVQYDEYFAGFSSNGQRYVAAGLIDRQSNKIGVLNTLPKHVAKFTGAHEVGHWVLHKEKVMHRDLPLDGSKSRDRQRSSEEREADYFAGCFLMPEKLVLDKFEQTFGLQAPIRFDENMAFWLGASDQKNLLWAEKNSYDRELVLARSQSFNMHHFDSLAQQFGVSNSAMAIRLKELEVVKWP